MLHLFLSVSIALVYGMWFYIPNKCSAVAEMGDRLAAVVNNNNNRFTALCPGLLR